MKYLLKKIEEARKCLEDLLISLNNHLDRAVEDVDKQRTKNRIDALSITLRILERCNEKQIIKVLEEFITHILWYHDKECGRTEDVGIIFKERFSDLAQSIIAGLVEEE